MKDERESGLREISIGMVAEVKLSYKLGYMSGNERDEVIEALKSANLPTAIPEYINREELVKKLYTDKKVKNGVLRFVI